MGLLAKATCLPVIVVLGVTNALFGYEPWSDEKKAEV